MFRGRYENNIDPKGRISIPVRFREILLQKYDDSRVFVTNFDHCLLLFPYSEWIDLEDKASKISMFNKEYRSFIRFFISSAAECSLDNQGRILIPQPLRKYAGLEKEVVLLGALKKIEIWDKKRWDDEIETLSNNIETISEAISQLGL
jgi:MraZ protein